MSGLGETHLLLFIQSSPLCGRAVLGGVNVEAEEGFGLTPSLGSIRREKSAGKKESSGTQLSCPLLNPSETDRKDSITWITPSIEWTDGDLPFIHVYSFESLSCSTAPPAYIRAEESSRFSRWRDLSVATSFNERWWTRMKGRFLSSSRMEKSAIQSHERASTGFISQSEFLDDDYDDYVIYERIPNSPVLYRYRHPIQFPPLVRLDDDFLIGLRKKIANLSSFVKAIDSRRRRKRKQLLFGK